MTPTRLLVGQIAVVFAIVILGVWSATQWCAEMLGYQAQLGSPWFALFGWPVYEPWKLFEWWYHYEAYAPEVFDKAGMLAAGSGFMGCAAAIIGSLWRARQSRLVTTYGSSRWALPREIERAGLFRPSGVFLGRLRNRYLRHDGPEHVMAFAPTRSGKGVGLVVPTLLSWTGSAVIHDIKGENWQLTAGWRSKFSHCLLFNPTDPCSVRYNPLLEVRKGPDEVRDVQNIADILVDPEGALERRNHWEKTSHALLVGAILHVLYAEREKTLARVATFLSDPRRSFAATLRRMMATNHLGTAENPQVHPVVASAAREVLNKSENERSGVLSTAMSFLGLYRDPTVAATTSACDWRIADLMDAEHPVSLYLVIPPSDISRTKPLVRLVLNQIGRRLAAWRFPSVFPAACSGSRCKAASRPMWSRSTGSARRAPSRRRSRPTSRPTPRSPGTSPASSPKSVRFPPIRCWCAGTGFPRRIDQGEAPPLFVVGADGGNQLVNYRMRGNYYIVDRLFAAAELRLGAKSASQVVRISRTDGTPRRTAPFSRTDR